MNRLPASKRAEILSCLAEGMGVNGTCRHTGAAKNTVLKLLLDAGEAVAKLQDDALRDLRPATVECDETWTYCHAKAANLPEHLKGRDGYGDVWTWVAIDVDSKLAITWHVGKREMFDASIFFADLHARLATVPAVRTDKWKGYTEAVDLAFGGKAPHALRGDFVGDKRATTSYVERQNLNMRMNMRRFTRKTNGFSRKLRNLEAAVALHFFAYNLVRPHGSLGKNTTPAMAAGATDRRWRFGDVVELLDSN